MQRRTIFLFLLFLAVLSGLSSCREDRFSDDPSCRLRFSADTLRFDTLFAERGSATKLLKVYNDYSNRLKINSITLDGKSFRVNVDGVAADSCGPLVLHAHDSLLVYVQSMVEDAASAAPYRVTGQLRFELNGHRQAVGLEAWGRSAHRVGASVISHDTTWTGELPFLVFDTVTVAEGTTLTITEGTTLYFTNRGGLQVYGALRCEGTVEKPVVMRGDRSDCMNTLPPLPYDLSPGQWRGIRFRTSSDNRMAWTEVRNSSDGVVLDSTALPQSLELDHCRMSNATGCVLTQRGGTLRLLSCLLYNAAENVINVQAGTCELIHCTVANYYGFSWSSRTGSSLRIANYMHTDRGDLLPTDVTFSAVNCMVTGAWTNEFTIDQADAGGTLDYTLRKCMLNKRLSDISAHYDNCIFNGKSGFVFEDWEEGEHPFLYDFHLTSASSAVGGALKSAAESCPLDLDGKDRTADGQYDLGCYAYR